MKSGDEKIKKKSKLTLECSLRSVSDVSAQCQCPTCRHRLQELQLLQFQKPMTVPLLHEVVWGAVEQLEEGDRSLKKN